MKHLSFLFLLVLLSSCRETDSSLQESDIIGISFEESVEIPNGTFKGVSHITFKANNNYERSLPWYLQNEGKYFIKNDYVEVHYACGRQCPNNDNCAVQRYVLGEEGNLHLIFLREDDGTVLNLDETLFDLELERAPSEKQ